MVKALASAIGRSKSSINEYANVAQAWPRKDAFESLAEKKDKFGKPLSWSHFAVIATAEDATQRDPLIATAIENVGR